VDDKDNHSEHPTLTVDNKMKQNDATMWLDGSPDSAVIATSVAMGLPSADNLSSSEAAEANAGIAAEIAAGGDPTRTEPLERDSPGFQPVSTSAPPQLSSVSEPPEGSNGATGDWNNYSAIANDEFLEFRGRPMLPGAEDESQVDPEVADIARKIAQRVGVRLFVNSAYRDRTHNSHVGGASNSLHMRGYALDIAWTSSNIKDRQNFIKYAIEAGAQGIGIYNSFCHIDIGNKRAWGPNGSRTSLPNFPWAQAVLSQAGYATS
jgi:hypothetical protein